MKFWKSTLSNQWLVGPWTQSNHIAQVHALPNIGFNMDGLKETAILSNNHLSAEIKYMYAVRFAAFNLWHMQALMY